jgi:DNA polymerase-3 subunit epsilon
VPESCEDSALAPPLDLVIEPADGEAIADAAARLPSRRGVLALEDDQGRTLSLAATADVRRCAAARLAAPAGAARALARTTGSAFESDWIWLAQARRRLPNAVRVAVDRWPAWFIHVDAEAEHPRFVKVARPGRGPSGWRGEHLGPFIDKHSAARYMELLDHAFDLCRYHHILVQAPRGTACAYRQMGRCPAPCDGSVTMTSYRGQVEQAMRFAALGHDRWSVVHERARQEAADRRDFESAATIQRRIADAAPAARPQYRHVNTLSAFRFLAVAPAERRGWARLFAIDRGRITMLGDVASKSSAGTWVEAVAHSNAALCGAPARTPIEDEIDQLGLVCWHLFRPRTSVRETTFLPAHEPIEEATLVAAIRRAGPARPSRPRADRPRASGAKDDEDRVLDALDGAVSE